MNYKKLRVFGRGRRRLLEDEDDDDWLGGVGMATTTQYRDYPASVASSSHPFGIHSRGLSGSAISALASNPPTPMQDLHPPQPTSPYLMGMRAASSGSIFHEAVWPPPSEANRFIDPLVAGSSQVDLGRIVPDVMGTGRNSPAGASASTHHGRAPSQTALLSSQSSPSASPTHQAPPMGAQPSHSLTPSWERAPGRTPSQALHDFDYNLEQGPGSPVVELPQTRLFIKNAEPLSPDSHIEPDSQAQSSKRVSGSPGGSPRWLDRQVKKD